MDVRMLVAAALVAGSAHAATAAPAGGTLTLTGSPNGYVDVRFTSPVTMTLRDVTVETSGSYAGFAVAERGGDLIATTTLVSRLGPGALVYARNQLQGTAQLAAGTYRLYLLADGPSTVTVPVKGRGAARTLRASGRVPASGRVLDLGDAMTVARRIPLRAGPRTFALIAVSRYTAVGVASRAAACFRPNATDDCAIGDTTAAAGNGLSSLERRAVAWPGQLTAGSHGVLQADGVAVGTKTTGFYLTFEPR